MEILELEEVVEIHNDIINEHGGLEGIKDMGQLESSLNNAFSTFFGEDLYKTDIEKITNIFFLLVKNHCFNDANKRTAVSVFNILVAINNVNIEYFLNELEDLAIDIAENNKDMNDVAEWISSRVV